jgi:hypothetical protein
VIGRQKFSVRGNFFHTTTFQSKLQICNLVLPLVRRVNWRLLRALSSVQMATPWPIQWSNKNFALCWHWGLFLAREGRPVKQLNAVWCIKDWTWVSIWSINNFNWPNSDVRIIYLREFFQLIQDCVFIFLT